MVISSNKVAHCGVLLWRQLDFVPMLSHKLAARQASNFATTEIPTVFAWEHVPKWIRGCWTQEQKVWDSSSSTDHLAEVSDKLWFPHCLGPLNRNGYLVYRSKAGSIVLGCIGTHLAGEGKVCWTCPVMDAWTVNDYLYLLPLLYFMYIVFLIPLAQWH